MSQYKCFAQGWIDTNRRNLSDWHHVIWHYAEPAFREYKSCAWYVELLRKEGFTVEEGSGDMPTAFCATFSNGEGPTLATYAEAMASPFNGKAGLLPTECSHLRATAWHSIGAQWEFPLQRAALG